MKPKKNNLLVPFRQSTSENTAFDRKALAQLAYSHDPEGRAEKYAEALYNSANGADEARTKQFIEFLGKKTGRAAKELATREQEREDFLRSPNLNDQEKPVMSADMIRTQRFLLLGIVSLLIIGTSAVSIYLMRWGEPFMTSVLKSVLFSLTMTVLMAAAFKALLSSFRSERIQGGIAIGLSIIGTAAGIFALTANSHFYAPEPKDAVMDRFSDVLSLDFPDDDTLGDPDTLEADEASLSASMANVSTSDSDAPESEREPFWTHVATPWVMEAQILAEASIASVFAFLYCRNRRAHREVSARRTPEFRDLEKRIVEAEAALRKAHEELGEAEGGLESLVSARNAFKAEIVGQVLAIKHSQNLISSLSGTEFSAA